MYSQYQLQLQYAEIFMANFMIY